MADPSIYSYPSPLEGWENSSQLPDEKAEDGKSESITVLDDFQALERFLNDIHIYYFQKNAKQLKFARELWERIRREFPELRIYRFWKEPIGPHPIAMFEVNLFTPAQFGAFIPWLVINRGPLSALVHPNTVDSVSGEHEDEYRDHTQRATWLGQPVPLDFSMFHEIRRMKERAAAEKKKDLVTELNKE